MFPAGAHYLLPAQTACSIKKNADRLCTAILYPKSDVPVYCCFFCFLFFGVHCLFIWGPYTNHYQFCKNKMVALPVVWLPVLFKKRVPEYLLFICGTGVFKRV